MTVAPDRPRAGSIARLWGVALATSLVAGCATQPDMAPVGAIADDYRTNHPIIVSEQEQVRDIPVGLSDEGLSILQRTVVRGFIAEYDRSAAPMVHVLRPTGSANERAAATLTGQIFELLLAEGVPVNKVTATTYDAGDLAALAPIRLSYTKMLAHAGPCGLWPEDLTRHADNRHYANFGCAYQRNMAAQIANPADLLGPRPPSEINAERRGVTIGDYQANDLVLDTETTY